MHTRNQRTNNKHPTSTGSASAVHALANSMSSVSLAGNIKRADLGVSAKPTNSQQQKSPRMYDGARKTSQDTCTSSLSPASSPVTPVMSSPPMQHLVADLSKQSAPLDSIDAWSAVHQEPTIAAAAAKLDIHMLGQRYDSLAIDRRTADGSAAPESALAGGTLEYAMIDEAILRGRSTTLPNIFAAPNPLRRISTMTSLDSAGINGPVSPTPSAGYSGMLSQQQQPPQAPAPATTSAAPAAPAPTAAATDPVTEAAAAWLAPLLQSPGQPPRRRHWQ
ncbi:hypothetical protein DL89DRAFT_52240 [Linderina pennispora]|uniref:Uncharacterized protein n=1 Tax=Linderina pennispora TaxID=61395 RepID=A0A1Y1W0T9_9FUNG|nr:uncharacterized protein DL89DRAFT_52240 [Linderina pennispora]ORX67108.1 hypothetical protein DL89DRAFT_52240 [Linderina pennispora]